MDIVIDFSGIPTDNPVALGWYLLANGGWLVFVLMVIYYGFQFWLAGKRMKYRQNFDWITLSINIPRIGLEFSQYPKAVEHIFTSLAGTYSRNDWIQEYFLGKCQPEFSFELVSHGGYIEYLIRTPRKFRDLVEAAVYAQYPAAELAEVPDYTAKYKNFSWPDNDGGYDVWGTTYKLIKKHFYPIKTWPKFFEEKVPAKEGGFKDALANVLEILAKLRPGEEFWYQIVITPIARDWQKEGHNFAKNVMANKAKPNSVGGTLFGGVFEILGLSLNQLAAKPVPEKKPEDKSKELTAKERGVIEAMQEKISKMGFRTVIRVVYLAPKELFQKNKVKEAFRGALGQYTDLYSNGLAESKLTKVSTSHLYFFPNYRVNHFRKNLIFKKYCSRSTRFRSKFGQGFIFNVEELASLWHFPVGDTRSLMIKKADVKRAEAPFYLPVEEPEEQKILIGNSKENKEPEVVSIQEEGGPPDNLPVG